MPRPRRRWKWLLAGAVVGMTGLAWAFTAGSDTSSRFAARSLRAAVGPPAPPDEGDEPQTEPAALAVTHVDLGEALPLVGPPAPPPSKPRGLPNTSFVLLLGLDNRSDKVTGRTDTMILVAFRHRDGKVGAFSIPRDLWIDIPELGQGARISSVVRVGNARVGAGEGLPMLREVIERELGIRVDRYAAVDLAGFVELVDHVGGVDVDVPCAIEDCLWLHPDDAACAELSLEAGRQHVDGETALMFARSRHGTGDRDRRRRQQAVLMGFARAVQDEGLLGLRELWETASPYVETDLDWDAAAYYASFALENELNDIHGFSIRGGMVSKHVTEKKQHVLQLDRDAFDTALSEMFSRELPALRERKRCPAPDAAAAARARRAG